MVDSFALQVWLYRALACVLVGLWSFLALLPLGGPESALPWPDIIFCVMIAWVVRRPDLMPFPLVVLLGLVMDFLFFKTPGAWTLVMLISTEVLRKSTDQEGDSGLAFEAVAVFLTMLGAFLGHRAILALFGAPQPPLGGTLLELVFTILAYPLVALVTVYIFRIRRPDPLETLSFKVRA
jgi:rod shape-determining protein MreD